MTGYPLSFKQRRPGLSPDGPRIINLNPGVMLKLRHGRFGARTEDTVYPIGAVPTGYQELLKRLDVSAVMSFYQRRQRDV